MNYKKYLRYIPIIKRLYPSFFFKILKILDKEKIIYKFQNILLELNIYESMDRSILFFNYYENKQINFLKQKICNGNFEYFLDIGGNSGLYSLIVASLSKNIKIIAFEPIKKTFLKFKRNIKLNDFKNIKIFNFGLSNNNKELKVKAYKKNNKIQSGGFSVANSSDDLNNLHIEKAVFKNGDQLIKLVKKKIYIKIDVEGHEQFVIDGLLKLIKKNHIFLQVEIFNHNKKIIFKKLKSLNFKIISKVVDDLKIDYFFEKKIN
jgi:FkbM family methyltransferase